MSHDETSSHPLVELLHRVAEHAPTYGFARLDPDRFPDASRPTGLRARLRQAVWDRWFEPHFQARTENGRRALRAHRDVLEQLGTVYDALGDDASRAVLLDVLVYRLLGPDRARMPRDTPRYWADRRRVEACVSTDGDDHPHGARLHRLGALGHDIELVALTRSVQAAFVERQYAYPSAGIEARHGDVVLDCGACWGDTTLEFAGAVGEEGRVHAFEFVPENLDLLRRNLARNRSWADRIVIHEHPVWSADGEELAFTTDGDASRLDPDAAGGRSVVTTSIDATVAAHGIDRVDLIKMDVEGAELAALHGARETLRRFRPKLAICVYHRPDDLESIPTFVQALDLGYELYLDHCTTYYEETVLFARVADRPD